MRTFLRSRRTFAIGLPLLALFVFLAFGAADCGYGSTPSQQTTDQNNNDSQTQRLHNADGGYPNVTKSNELANIKKRFERLNSPNEIGYIYVFTNTLIYGPYQVKGKCTSSESLYSSPVDVIPDPHASSGSLVVPAAQPDGSYGQSEAAIFCILNDAGQHIIEFNTRWTWTEVPLLGMPTVPGSAVIPNGK